MPINKAKKIYSKFHKKEVDSTQRINISLPKKAVVYLGKIKSLNYIWTHDNREYRHDFKNSKMYTDEAGKCLIISPCKITARGIED